MTTELNTANLEDSNKEVKKVELNDRNKRALEIIKDVINKYDLEWTDESIDYVLNTENKSFSELRILDGRRTANRLIIQAGLKVHDKSKAFSILTEIREQGVPAERLHPLLIHILREKHFFMEVQDLDDLNNLVEVGIERDVSLQNLLTDVSERMNELNSLS